MNEISIEEIREAIEYGFQLYPFAILLTLGFYISGFGVTVFRGLMSGMSGSALYRPLLITGTLALELIAGIVAFTGLMGGFYRILKDTRQE